MFNPWAMGEIDLTGLELEGELNGEFSGVEGSIDENFINNLIREFEA
jgi:hypothetical protein